MPILAGAGTRTISSTPGKKTAAHPKMPGRTEVAMMPDAAATVQGIFGRGKPPDPVISRRPVRRRCSAHRRRAGPRRRVFRGAPRESGTQTRHRRRAGRRSRPSARCISAMRATIARPSPALPPRRRSRRQNRRKICSRCAVGTPGPRSRTRIAPSAATLISTVVPGAVWASAFSTRLRTARAIASPLPRTRTGRRAPMTARVLFCDSASGARKAATSPAIATRSAVSSSAINKLSSSEISNS